MEGVDLVVRRQRGFSMLEILITLGILAVVIAGVATFVVNTGKQATSVAQKSDFNSLVNELQGIFNNTGTCLAALNSVTVPATLGSTPPVPVPVSVTVGSSTYAAGTKYAKLTITKLSFTGIQPASQAGQFVVPLVLEASRKTGEETATGGDMLRPHVFNLILALDSSRKIVGCSGQYSNYWVGASNAANNITYMGGNVGIGTDSPSALFDVNGTAQAKAFMYNSDGRLKENVRKIPNALQRVLALRGVIYDWKNTSSTDLSPDQLGFIAQDVEKIFPEAVSTNPATGLKSVGYGNLIAPLIEALKEQQAIIQKQQQDILQLKAMVQGR
jgi:prepilin-type N-terminal cleavage/methylation domain-containing protein